ncbi:MAG TPA: hypothetical protein VKV26_05940 [Dehalococcoidia bacterium]|nr:hypothetical protein [Dehalococcoidia bacterium]
MLRHEAGDDALANHAIHNEDDPALGPRERAMAAYARKLTREPWSMTAADLDGLRGTGLSEEQVLDVVAVACLFNFMTRLADGLGVDIEERKAAAVRPWLEQRTGAGWDFLRLPPATARRSAAD